MDTPHVGGEGYIRYGVQSAQGSPVTANLALGAEIGRCRFTSNKGNVYFFGVGANEFTKVKPGEQVQSVTVPITAVSDAGLLAQALRADGLTALPWLTLELGWQPSGTGYGLQLQDCKVARLSGNIRQRERLQLEMTFEAGKITETTGASMLFGLDAPFFWYEAVWDNGEIESLEFDVDYGVEPKFLIAGPSTVRPFKRSWDKLKEGQIRVTGRSTQWTEASLFVQNDSSPASDVALRFTDANLGSHKLGLVFKDFVLDGHDLEITDGNQEINTTLPFTAKNLAVETSW